MDKREVRISRTESQGQKSHFDAWSAPDKKDLQLSGTKAC